MKTFRYVLWGAVFVLGAFLAYATMNWTLQQQAGTEAGRADVGGAFTATLASGEKITQDDLKGKPHVIFFGFTHCPDICPTTLFEASAWLKELGTDGDRLGIYFVTVDPARDTKELLAQYLTAFDPRIKGITGTQEEIDEIARKWRVFVQKVGEGDDYSVSHTSNVFLMNSRGEFMRTIAYGENKDVALQKLRKLLSEEG